ncbi:hypothetical protein [Marinoscillum sp. MHG1-6]|uniref:hypothetical protein n=1 Tax=Marinoscillum sp. MHG1-6 TaxID=2959627 RepID=UPI002157C0FC|nr:hypothetical protein [Marinoscillum sp. MHG1-6]
MLLFAHISFIAFVVWFFGTKANSELKPWYYAGLIWRMALALIFGWTFFIHFEEGDTVHFFTKANELADLANVTPDQYIDYLLSSHFPHYKAEARNDFFIKIVSILSLLTNNNYWIISLYFSLLSFASVWYLYKNMVGLFPSHKYAAALGFLIFPGPIFWTSGILKDSIIFSAFLFITAICLKLLLRKKTSPWEAIGVLISFYLIWELRYFIFALTAIGFIITLIEVHFASALTSIRSKLTFWSFVLPIMVIAASYLSANLNLLRFPYAITENYHLMVSLSQDGKYFSFDIEPTWVSIFTNLPQSISIGLFRPIFKSDTLIYLPYGLENLCVALLTIASFCYYIKRPMKIHFPAILVLGYILTCATIFPLSSPNIGTLMRYKAIYLPLMIYIISIPLSSSLLQDRLKS